MEDVVDRFGSEDDIGPEWPLEHYGVVARHLGRFNGAYLMGDSTIPSCPWLRSRDYFRDALEEAAPFMARIRANQDHPLVRRRFPPDVVNLYARRWAEQEQHLRVLDRIPATLCHGDAFRGNFCARRSADGDYLTVAIDWAVLGTAWIGRDITMLVSNTMSLLNTDREEAREQDRIAFAGYVEGLRDAGWQGDPNWVRLGQILWISIPRVQSVDLELCLDESQHAWLEQSLGGTIAELADLGPS
jgi:hypothetical protein